MADIQDAYDDDSTIHLRALMASGRREKAIEYAQEQLRTGAPSKRFLAAVADLMEPPVNPRHRPRSAAWRWWEIGQAFDELQSAGKSYQDALADLAETENVSESSIARAVRYYRETLADADAATRDSH